MLISNFKNKRYVYIFISFLFCIIYSEDSELTYNINSKLYNRIRFVISLKESNFQKVVKILWIIY